MKALFSAIDTSRPYLLLGDTDHEKPEIQMAVYTPEFMAVAKDAGYQKILMEMSATNAQKFNLFASRVKSALGESYVPPVIDRAVTTLTKDAAISDKDHAVLKAICFADYFGMKLVPVDPRDEHDKARLIREALHDVARVLNGQTSTGGLQKANDAAMEKDDALLETIKKEGKDAKIIVLYGAHHFALGTEVERGISESQRVIINLQGRDPDVGGSKVPAPDARTFSVVTQEFTQKAGRQTAPAVSAAAAAQPAQN